MINNFDFVKKNNVEIFKSCCFELNQNLDTLISQVTEIRNTLYQCNDLQIRPIIDSTHENDCLVMNKVIKECQFEQEKEVFQQALMVIEIYKDQFKQINRNIQVKLKKVCDLHKRNSLNRKMYENLMSKQSQLNNYFYSVCDSDSPTKIKSDVFTF